jgi:hypothetical protein
MARSKEERLRSALHSASSKRHSSMLPAHGCRRDSLNHGLPGVSPPASACIDEVFYTRGSSSLLETESLAYIKPRLHWRLMVRLLWPARSRTGSVSPRPRTRGLLPNPVWTISTASPTVPFQHNPLHYRNFRGSTGAAKHITCDIYFLEHSFAAAPVTSASSVPPPGHLGCVRNSDKSAPALEYEYRTRRKANMTLVPLATA